MQEQFTIILFYTFWVVFGLQISYWLFFLIGILRLRRSADSSSENPPPISIIVAAHNELDNLKELIPALMSQDHPQYEVIIVNDRSDDGTHEYLIEVENNFQNLKALHIHDLPEHITGKKYALTLGIKAAKFKQVLHTDADCTPSTTSWASKMSQEINGGADIVLGFSNYQKLHGLLNYFIRFETILTGIAYLGAAANLLPYMGVGRNLAYKKDLFLGNKGFFGYQQLVGGDDDLFINKHATSRNTAISVGSQSLVISKPKTSFKSFLHQKIRHLHVGKAYSFKSRVTLGVFNLSWILTWITGLTYLFIGSNIEYITYGLILRALILLASFILATKKLGISFEIVGVIFVDLLFAIYYIFVGTRAVFVKTISWA